MVDGARLILRTDVNCHFCQVVEALEAAAAECGWRSQRIVGAFGVLGGNINPETVGLWLTLPSQEDFISLCPLPPQERIPRDRPLEMRSNMVLPPLPEGTALMMAVEKWQSGQVELTRLMQVFTNKLADQLKKMC